jgi:hypothetical protein
MGRPEAARTGFECGTRRCRATYRPIGAAVGPQCGRTNAARKLEPSISANHAAARGRRATLAAQVVIAAREEASRANQRMTE